MAEEKQYISVTTFCLGRCRCGGRACEGFNHRDTGLAGTGRQQEVNPKRTGSSRLVRLRPDDYHVESLELTLPGSDPAGSER